MDTAIKSQITILKLQIPMTKHFNFLLDVLPSFFLF